MGYYSSSYEGPVYGLDFLRSEQGMYGEAEILRRLLIYEVLGCS